MVGDLEIAANFSGRIGARFCELGGAICLVKDEATGVEKYQLNLDSLSRAGFRVRSQLLQAQRQRSANVE